MVLSEVGYPVRHIYFLAFSMVDGTLGETKWAEGCRGRGDEEEPKPELRAGPLGSGRRGIWFERFGTEVEESVGAGIGHRRKG